MIEIYKSDKPNKKFYALYEGNKIYFGAPSYEHFTEGHLDEDRKMRYLKRATNIKDKQGNRTLNNILSPNFYSIYFLWMEKTYKKAKKLLERLTGQKVKLMF